MGNRISALSSNAPSSSHLDLSEKRKRHLEDAVIDHEVEDVKLTPQRKRILTTSDYIFETLYKRGADSDITIDALGTEWKLHKLYLRQSGYFSSMFSGSWKESNDSRITIANPDPNITTEALNIAFGSLYRDEIPLEDVHLCSTVAAASMLQLDGLLEHCKAYMRENMRSDTVVDYITTASMYSLHKMCNECRDWLLLHLLKRYTIKLLKDMRSQMLAEYLSSPDLYVMQIEMDVYTLAKKWLFLAKNPEWSRDSEKLLGDAEVYFRTKGRSGICFLSREEEKEYTEVFKSIRLQHIINDNPSIVTIEADKIIPEDWLLSLYRKQWLKMLSVDQRLDHGLSSLTEEQFNNISIRCGRVIYEPGEYCWRWTGFSFGFDTLVTYDSSTGIIKIKRNTKTQPCLSAVSMQPRRPMAVRLRSVSFNDKEAVFSRLNSGILHLSLTPDEEHSLLKNIPSTHFPIYISINFSLTSVNI